MSPEAYDEHYEKPPCPRILVLTQAEASQPIVGKWEAVEPADGPRRVLLFNRDGRFFESIGVSINGTYRLDGNRILVEEPANSDEPSEVVELRVKGNTLVMHAKDGETILRMYRRMPGAPGGGVARFSGQADKK